MADFKNRNLLTREVKNKGICSNFRLVGRKGSQVRGSTQKRLVLVSLTLVRRFVLILSSYKSISRNILNISCSNLCPLPSSAMVVSSRMERKKEKIKAQRKIPKLVKKKWTLRDYVLGEAGWSQITFCGALSCYWGSFDIWKTGGVVNNCHRSQDVIHCTYIYWIFRKCQALHSYTNEDQRDPILVINDPQISWNTIAITQNLCYESLMG